MSSDYCMTVCTPPSEEKIGLHPPLKNFLTAPPLAVSWGYVGYVCTPPWATCATPLPRAARASCARLPDSRDFPTFYVLFPDFSWFFSKFFRIFLNFSEFSWIFPIFSEFFRIFPNFSEFFWIFPNFSRIFSLFHTPPWKPIHTLIHSLDHTCSAGFSRPSVNLH